MSNELDPISSVFNTGVPVPLTPRPVKEETEAPEIEDDYQTARSNLKELIDQMMENVPDIISVMQQSQTDRMYNAAATFVKAAADLNVSLSKLSMDVKKKKGKESPIQEAPRQVTQSNTNVFVGSTENFLDILEKRRKEPETIDVEVQEVE